MDQLISIDLDSLLDTRLGLIAQYKPEWVEPLMKAGYRKRECDDFSVLLPDFPQAWFKEAYEQRTVETLKHSRPTPVVAMLVAMTTALEKQSINTPHVNSLTVEVNIYPYELTAGEQEVLIDMVTMYTALITKIVITRMSPDDLHPGLLKDKYSGIILYHFEHWLQTHIETLQRIKIPTVSMQVPMLYGSQGIPTEADRTIDSRGPINLFIEAEANLTDALGLNFTDVEYFSLVDVDKIRKGGI